MARATSSSFGAKASYPYALRVGPFQLRRTLAAVQRSYSAEE
jgi:hypothetical protein